MKNKDCGILCVFGVLSVLFGLFIPVLDDLCGPTVDRELQNVAPVFFWACVTIPTLFGVFLIIASIRCYKATNVSPKR